MKKPNITYILELTKRCNNQCKYCYNVWKADSSYPLEELDTEQWKKVIDNLADQTKPKLFGISGGEPLLRDDIYEILKHIKKHKTKISLITNGTLITKQIIEKLLDAGVDLFELTLLSSNPKTHDSLTRNQGSWQKVIEATLELKKQKAKLAIVIVVTKKNIHEISETAEIAIALGANSILVNCFNVGGEGIKYKNELLPSAKELEKAFEEIDRLALEYELSVGSGVAIPSCTVDTSKFKNIKFGYCQVGGKFPYYAIDPAGNVRPCNHSALILGNVLNQTMGEILENKIFCEYLNSFPKECQDCLKIAECKGGCKASAEVYFHDTERLNPFISENFKGIIR